jgi:hypothetical protein
VEPGVVEVHGILSSSKEISPEIRPASGQASR